MNIWDLEMCPMCERFFLLCPPLCIRGSTVVLIRSFLLLFSFLIKMMILITKGVAAQRDQINVSLCGRSVTV